MKQVHCIIFSISADLSKVCNFVVNLDSTFPLVVLTPHALFEHECKTIQDCFDGKVYFKSFANYISDAEAERCDRESYEYCIKNNGNENINLYMSQIKERKNNIILENFNKEYLIQSGIIFSEDLGIEKRVWLRNGFTHHITSNGSAYKRSVFKKIKSLLSNVFDFYKNYRILTYNGNNYLFCGNLRRLKQYLNNNVILKKTRYPLHKRVAWIFLILVSRFVPNTPSIIEKVEKSIVTYIADMCEITALTSSIHEHKRRYKDLALRLSLPYYAFQDGYIPENYSSYYYKILMSDVSFLVWDNLSAELFRASGMDVKLSPLYESFHLPKVVKTMSAIKNVVILTSGAGDWTAVKNRSDDDLMLMAFVKVAKELKYINFVYRCHPFWVHPTHQGESSIDRAVKYIKSTGLNNIKISDGSIANSNRYAYDKKLFIEPKSTADEILNADIVFGEHSYSMIDAAKKGKLFASVLIAKRRDYFINYSKLGFPHMASANEILQFIDNLESPSSKVFDCYNAAVQKYNSLQNNN